MRLPFLSKSESSVVDRIQIASMSERKLQLQRDISDLEYVHSRLGQKGIISELFSEIMGEEFDPDLELIGGRRRLTQFSRRMDYAAKYVALLWINIAVKKIALNLANVPLLIIDPETLESFDKHPLYNLFAHPNPHMSQQDFFERVMVYLESDGKTIIETRKTSTGDVAELYVPESFQFEMIPDAQREIREFRYHKDDSGNNYISYKPEDVIYVRYFNPLRPWDGLSPMSAAKMEIETDIHANIWNLNFFRKGTFPAGVLKTDREVSQEEADRLRERFRERHEGSERSHIIAILPKGLDYSSISARHVDMDFLQQQRNIRAKILGIYGVPLAVAGFYDFDNQSGRSAGVEQQYRDFWVSTMIPKMQKLVDAFNSTLGVQYGVEFAFDLDNVDALQPNQKLQAETAKAMVGTGLTWNEIREMAYGREPKDDLDWIPIPVNLISADGGSVSMMEQEINLPQEVELEEPMKNLREMADDELYGFVLKELKKENGGFRNRDRYFMKIKDGKVKANLNRKRVYGSRYGRPLFLAHMPKIEQGAYV